MLIDTADAVAAPPARAATTSVPAAASGEVAAVTASAVVAIQTPRGRRGPYSKISVAERLRIRDASDAGKDWKVVADANGVNRRTARRYIGLEDIEYKKRGGHKQRKLTEENIDVIQQWVEAECQLTLEEFKARIFNELNIEVAVSTIHRALDGRAFTFKDVHCEPLQMNTDEAKERRLLYVRQLRALVAEGKVPIWIDETNFNLFSARSKGRSRRNVRAVAPRNAPQKGKNLHIIGSMCAQGFFFAEHMRGAYRNDRANDWLRRLLRAASVHLGGMDQIVVICDNAPCHTRYVCAS